MKTQSEVIYVSIFPLSDNHPGKCTHSNNQNNFIAMVSGPGGDHTVVGCSTCMKSFTDTQRARGNCKVVEYDTTIHE